MLETYDWNALSGSERDRLLRRPAQDDATRVEQGAADIIARVRREGDGAVRSITAEIDGIVIEKLRVEPETIAAALDQCEPVLRRALVQARDNVRTFHGAQLGQPSSVVTVPGVVCERRVLPLESVGMYVPAGSAPLASSVIMQAVPAALAGCARRVLCSPPQADGRPDPAILAAAALCEVDEVYAVGGAQAIAAMAFGTESIAPVDKLFGPGNAWVAAAKRLVAQAPDGVPCDLSAGPSEVLVVADQSADPAFVAADLLAQAEHGADSQVLLVTTSAALAGQVAGELSRQGYNLSRAEIVMQCLATSPALVVKTLDDAFDVVNRYAPEHLILQVVEPRRWLERVRNAGSVFLGPWTPEALGDYCSGTNHVLPTGGHARHSSGLGVADFCKSITVQEATPAGLEQLAASATALAAVERLDAHGQSVRVRLARLRAGAA